MVQTHNYQMKVEITETTTSIRNAMFYIEREMKTWMPRFAPEYRQQKMMQVVKDYVNKNNNNPVNQKLHFGNGASHIWISFQGGEMNNERVAIITFENLYV